MNNDIEREWLYQDSSGQQIGPVTAEQFRQLVQSGHVSPQTNIWTQGLDDWVPASQVDGVFPNPAPAPAPAAAAAAPRPVLVQPAPATPYVQQQVPGHAGARQAYPQAAATPQYNPYARRKKSPVMLIILCVGGLLALVVGLMVAFAPSEEEKRTSIPGYAGFSDANKLITSNRNGAVHGNSLDAKKIASRISTLLKEFRGDAIEQAKHGAGSLTDGEFLTYVRHHQKGDQHTVVVLVQVPKLRKFADGAKKLITEAAWVVSRAAIADELGLDPQQTRLAVGVRGVALYEVVFIGKPVTDESVLEMLDGVEETHSGAQGKEKLYPFFIDG